MHYEPELERVKRQLWGVPVVLSTGVTEGNGYVVGEGSLMAFTYGVLSIKWAGINDDFAKNQIRCRAESRFQMGTVRPAGVVKFLYA